jgi:hypothetical protein
VVTLRQLLATWVAHDLDHVVQISRVLARQYSTKSARGGRIFASSAARRDESMVDVTIQGDRAVFNVEGLHKLWSFRSQIEIPLAHITGVDADPSRSAAGGTGSR